MIRPSVSGSPDVILVLQRCRTGATFGTVDDNEIRRDLLVDHCLADRKKLVPIADAQLETSRLPICQLTHCCDETDELAGGVEDLVRCRTDALLTLRHTARLRDLLGHLLGWKHAAETRLRALAELQRHALDLVVGCLLGKESWIELPVLSTGSEVSAANFPDQVASVLQVVWRETPLARIVGEAAAGRPGIQSPQCVGRQGSKAHCRNIQQRHVVGLRAVWSADSHPRLLFVRLTWG